MKRVFVILSMLFLTARSSFKVGGIVYCPQERDCKFEQTVHDAPK